MSKKELLQIRISSDQKEKIKRLAKEQKMNLSEFTLFCVMQQVNQKEDIKVKIEMLSAEIDKLKKRVDDDNIF